MINVQKLFIILRVLWTKLLLKITNTNLYQIEVISDDIITAYCLRTKKYYNVCLTMFYGDHINYHYNKPFVSHTIVKGKVILNTVLIS